MHARLAALLIAAAALLGAGWASADPPERVMRLGYVEGPVSFAPAGENDWVQATVNRPLIPGDSLWTEPDARAELQVGAAMLRVGGGTSVTLLNLDDRVVQVQLNQGTLILRVRRFDANDVLEIDTPNLAFSIRNTGDYRIDVDPAGNATTVVTRRGLAEIYGANGGYRADAGTAYRFYGTDLADYQAIAMPYPDDLDRWASARDRRWETSVSARYVSPEVVGYQDLDGYGTWRAEAGYGNVWVPRGVSLGWAPYQDGHWAWIDPWGWTWIDAAPWGFAVSHYGRWAYVRDAWCWVPAPVAARAVYAPALVAFVGGSGFNVAISVGSVPAVGWFPLGPRDVYVPAYPVSRSYFTQVNTTNTVINVTNVTRIYESRDVARLNYANRHVPGAVVAMPANAFAEAHAVGRANARVTRESLARAQVTTVAAVTPVPASVRGPAERGHRPPAQVLDRRVVARTVPAPAPIPFAAQERLLAQQPGKPLDRSAVSALRPTTAQPAPKVQMVATPNAAPGARGERPPGGAAPGARAAPVDARPAPSAPQSLQRGHAPAAQGQPARAMPVPAPAASSAPGTPEVRGSSAPPQSRGRPDARSQPPSGDRPDARAQPQTFASPGAAPTAPPEPPMERRGRPEPRSGAEGVPARQPAATSRSPQPRTAAPAPQRAQPEPRGGQEPKAARPASAPAPVAPPPASETRGHGGGKQPPTGDAQRKGGNDRKPHNDKDDDKEMKRR